MPPLAFKKGPLIVGGPNLTLERGLISKRGAHGFLFKGSWTGPLKQLAALENHDPDSYMEALSAGCQEELRMPP